MELAFAAATFLAAVGATYFFCVRPMRQGRHCAMSPPTDTSAPASHTTTSVTAQDLQAVRAELDALRATMAHSDNDATVEKASTTARRHTSDTESPTSGAGGGAG